MSKATEFAVEFMLKDLISAIFQDDGETVEKRGLAVACLAARKKVAYFHDIQDAIEETAAKLEVRRESIARHLNARRHHRIECRCDDCSSFGCSESRPCRHCLGAAR